MAVAFKASGALYSTVSATVCPVPTPAYAVGDYAIAVVIAFAAGTVTPPAGWAEVDATWQEASLYYHTFWKKITTAASAGTENFTMPSAGALAKVSTFTGAGSTAPTRSVLNSGTTPVAYWSTPVISQTGFYISNALLFSSRTPNGYSTTGTITVTTTVLNHEQPSASGLTGFRWDTATHDVTAVTSGQARVTVSGGTTTYDDVLLRIPAGGIAPPVETNTLTFNQGGTELPALFSLWQDQEERGFWYPVGNPYNKLSYNDGGTERFFTVAAEPTTSAVDGADYVAYGDSYGVVQTAGGVDYTAADLFPAQLAAAIDAASYTNRHVNSYMAMDVAYMMNNSSSANRWLPTSFSFVTIHAGGNDLKLAGTAAGLNEYINGIQAIIGLLRMNNRIQASAGTSSGTWANVSTSGTSGAARSTTTPGATRTLNVSGNDATLFLLAARDGSGSAFTVKVDSGTPAAFTTVGQAAVNPVVSGNYGLVPVHLRNMGAGTHTVIVTHTGSSGQTLIVDSIVDWIPVGDMPYILFAASPWSEGYEIAGGDIPTLDKADIMVYRNALRTILNQHPGTGKIGLVMPDSYDKTFWKPVAEGVDLLISDNMHPNKAGCDLLSQVWIGNTRRVFLG